MNFLGSSKMLLGTKALPNDEKISISLESISSPAMRSFHLNELEQYLLKGDIEMPKLQQRSELTYDTSWYFIRRVSGRICQGNHRGIGNTIIVPSFDRSSSPVDQVTQILQETTPLTLLFSEYINCLNDPFDIIISDILPQFIMVLYRGYTGSDQFMTLVDDTCYYLNPEEYIPYTSYYKLIPIETFDNVVKEFIEQYDKENNN